MVGQVGGEGGGRDITCGIVTGGGVVGWVGGWMVMVGGLRGEGVEGGGDHRRKGSEETTRGVAVIFGRGVVIVFFRWLATT